ncbi:hypothetical protein GALMADRAFT_236653 [Galerina marginata CBS 339.88]|uniref:Virilizer N-terminal domain-containing protein n=1 Tax=Galerina marginata (strain CBS 339.88) TaxID=685588 RepID=A0A067TVU2_GALM3|nr:hypothetical protein GALMADRAFT_236653 [Galerina marginata CBS 339.88]
MRLLGWYQLNSRNCTAAILYPAPVRVSSIRIFPTGAQPFNQSPDIIALTEPEAFFLDVYFNIVSTPPSNSQDSQDKRASKNALAPTRIAYAGGQTEFTVDMGSEYATRLIIFHGEFKSVFIAIYGDSGTSEQPEVATYEPKALPVSTSMPLSSSVDPTNSPSPVLLAEQLLKLLPISPPLHVATRLLFSLKPESEDWDHPEFPNLYSELDVAEDSDLEGLVNSSGRPIRDEISSDSISTFATIMHDSLGSNPIDDAYYVGKLLYNTASQQTRFSRILLQHLDLPQVFNEKTLDETNTILLRDAAANIEIARYFSEDQPFLRSLEELHKSPKTEKPVQKALNKLLTRMRGWRSFEDALINPSGDFAGSAAFLKDIAIGEHSVGCWLECMINHDNLVAKLAATPPRDSGSLPPLLFQERLPEPSHESFIVFVRALMGVLTVLGSLAWADSIGNDQCRERSLAVLLLWQGIDGYREIVNHCLLLRQITRRLGWNKSDDIPRKLGILAERLLVGLAKDPQAMLRDDLINTVLSLEPPFSFISTEELMEIGKLARVARDGLSSAIEELAYTSLRPFSLRRLRVLRISLAIVAEELTYDDGEWRVLENFWLERSQGIMPRLLTILVDISDDLNHHFSLQPPSRMNQTLSELLFRTADDILHLSSHFTATYPLISRDLRTMTAAISDLYACSDAASTRFSHSSVAYLAAQNIRRSCPEILRSLTNRLEAESGTSGPQVVFRVLLDPPISKTVRDPVHHISQVYDLLENILPKVPSDTDAQYWVMEVFPKVLPELKSFCRLLDPETRTTFIERLVTVDNGEIGMGEWLLTEELKELSTALNKLSGLVEDEDYKLVLQYQVSSSIHFCQLLTSSPQTAKWVVSSLSANEDLSQQLDICISLILDTNLCSLPLAKLTRHLGKHANDFGPDVRFNLLLLVLRNAQADPTALDALDSVPGILNSLPSSSISPERLRDEVGRMISAYADHASSMKTDNADMMLQILEWLASQEDSKLTTLVGISTEAFHYLCTTLAATLPIARQAALSSTKGKLSIDEDELFPPSTTELPDALTMPLRSVENLLAPRTLEPPSTPKRGNKTPDILGVVISPPAAILRSPAATGLTKTYQNNDFRQLRQVQSTRLNTSRMPSTHVDVGINGRSDLSFH